MLDILTIGTATRDAFLELSSGYTRGGEIRLPAGSKISVSDTTLSVGGGAANAAVTFARGGLATGALVRVGDDTSGRDVRTVLAADGVRVFALIDKKRDTAYGTILRSRAGERTVLIHHGAAEAFTRAELLRAPRARWAYVAPGAINPDCLIPFLAKISGQGTRIAVNPSRRYLALPKSKLAKLLSLADVVIANREEASLMTGVPQKNLAGIFRKFDRLVPGIALLTDGARGAHVSDGRTIWSAGIFKHKKIVDRTGAGDAFGSAFTLGIIRGFPVAEAIRMGAANATSVIEVVGTQAGILTGSQYAAPRWRNLRVIETKLSL